MMCPKCGNKTKVVSSRKGDNPVIAKKRPSMHNYLARYTQDWVFRRRGCVECGLRFNTAELIYQDLLDGWELKESDDGSNS
jgi:transcriptional regulator NrdR family protein